MERFILSPLRFAMWLVIRAIVRVNEIANRFGDKLKAKHHTKASQSSEPFHCVEIVVPDDIHTSTPDEEAIEVCSLAHSRMGQRFLSEEAPTLPLKGCDCEHCYCRYRHYKDRRTGQRRSKDPIQDELYPNYGVDRHPNYYADRRYKRRDRRKLNVPAY